MIEFVALRITYFTVNTTTIMEEWKAELETFYETEGTKKVTKELNIKSAVLITGNSGIGKTATMKYVSFFSRKKGMKLSR